MSFSIMYIMYIIMYILYIMYIMDTGGGLKFLVLGQSC